MVQDSFKPEKRLQAGPIDTRLSFHFQTNVVQKLVFFSFFLDLFRSLSMAWKLRREGCGASREQTSVGVVEGEDARVAAKATFRNAIVEGAGLKKSPRRRSGPRRKPWKDARGGGRHRGRREIPQRRRGLRRTCRGR